MKRMGLAKAADTVVGDEKVGRCVAFTSFQMGRIARRQTSFYCPVHTYKPD